MKSPDPEVFIREFWQVSKELTAFLYSFSQKSEEKSPIDYHKV
jgi:hypothetical protein